MTLRSNKVPVGPAIVCPRCPTVLPYTPYTPPKPQWGNVLKPAIKFTIGGRLGIPLGLDITKTIQHLDFADEPILTDCGPKFMLIIHPNGYRPFKIQKHAYTHPKGKRAPNNRAKVVTQVMEGMAAFIARGIPDLTNPADHFVFGEGGIKLEDLVLLELHHVAKSSFQPVFGLKCKCPPAPSVAAPEPSLEGWLTDMSQWEVEGLYDNANLFSVGAYAPTYPLPADEQLAQWVLDFMSMDNT